MRVLRIAFLFAKMIKQLNKIEENVHRNSRYKMDILEKVRKLLDIVPG